MTIKETKELLDLGFEIAKAGKSALADGKVNLFDLPVVIPVLAKVGPGIEGANLVLAELKDLSEAENKELLDYCKAKLPEVVNDGVAQAKMLVFLKAGLAICEAISAL